MPGRASASLRLWIGSVRPMPRGFKCGGCARPGLLRDGRAPHHVLLPCRRSFFRARGARLRASRLRVSRRSISRPSASAAPGSSPRLMSSRSVLVATTASWFSPRTPWNLFADLARRSAGLPRQRCGELGCVAHSLRGDPGLVQFGVVEVLEAARSFSQLSGPRYLVQLVCGSRGCERGFVGVWCLRWVWPGCGVGWL
jgi:hypothetical protein